MTCGKCRSEVPDGYTNDAGICFLCAPLDLDTTLEIVQRMMHMEIKLSEICASLEQAGCAVGFDGKHYFVTNSFRPKYTCEYCKDEGCVDCGPKKRPPKLGIYINVDD